MIIVFDKSDRDSFDSIESILPININSHTLFLLLGNKDDADRIVITDQEAHEFAREHGMRYYSASARTKNNCSDITD